MGRVLGRTEMFEKPVTESVPRLGFLHMEYSVWKQMLVHEVPSVVNHEVRNFNAPVYWLILSAFAHKRSYDKETDKECMVRCLAFSVVFVVAARSLLTMRMDYYHLKFTSGAAIAA